MGGLRWGSSAWRQYWPHCSAAIPGPSRSCPISNAPSSMSIDTTRPTSSMMNNASRLCSTMKRSTEKGARSKRWRPNLCARSDFSIAGNPNRRQSRRDSRARYRWCSGSLSSPESSRRRPIVRASIRGDLDDRHQPRHSGDVQGPWSFQARHAEQKR